MNNNNIAGLDVMIRTQLNEDGKPSYFAYVGTEGPVTSLRADVQRYSALTRGDLLAQIIKAYA